MRKLLMAGAACVTGLFGMAGFGTADAAQLYSLSNAPMALAAPKAQSPAPGQVVVNLDMRINAYVEGNWNTGNHGAAGFKSDPLGIVGYGRLYLGVNGQALNGLKYGLFMEIRENNQTVSGSASDLSSGASAGSATGTLFWRRNYVYVGTDQVGTMRLGQTDGPYTLMTVGEFDDFGTGGWDGDLPAGFGPIWPWADVGNVYTTGKIVYLSPALAGFDFGISYEPSTANMAGSFNNQAFVSTTPLPADLSRRRNTIEAAVRYRGAFSGVGIATNLSGMFGGHTNASFANPGINGVTKFDNIALGDFGLALTFAGVTFGGNVEWGQMNGQFAVKPDGGSNAIAWIGGAEWTGGPLTVGAAYYQYQYQGTPGIPTQRRDMGVQIGANYNIAPGLQFIAEYIWGNSRQNAGIDGNGDFHSRFYQQEQALGAGFQLRW